MSYICSIRDAIGKISGLFFQGMRHADSLSGLFGHLLHFPFHPVGFTEVREQAQDAALVVVEHCADHQVLLNRKGAKDFDILICPRQSHLCNLVGRHICYIRVKQSDCAAGNINRAIRILSDVEKNYFKKLQLSDYARQEGISLYYLSRFFRETVGMSFRQYLGKVRLERAISRLLDTDMSILEISIECGYSDVKYLRQAFQQEYGCSIAEFRRRNEAQKSDNDDSGIEMHLTRGEHNFCLFDGENAIYILENGRQQIVFDANDIICSLLKEDRTPNGTGFDSDVFIRSKLGLDKRADD